VAGSRRGRGAQIRRGEHLEPLASHTGEQSGINSSQVEVFDSERMWRIEMAKDVWPVVRQEMLDWLGSAFDASDLDLETRLREDLGLSSLKTVDLIVRIEEVFDISISDDDLGSLKTIGDVVEVIRRKVEGADVGR
jgi:acyl carrier protein